MSARMHECKTVTIFELSSARMAFPTWMSSEMGNWLGMAPSSGSVGPWTMIFLADGTLAVIKMLASTCGFSSTC